MQSIATRLRDGLLPVAGRLIDRPSFGDVDDTILIIQPDHLGDILLSQPAVRYLREAHPMTHLVAVVGPWSSEIASFAWPVDEIVTIAFPGFTRAETGSPLAPYQLLRVESQTIQRYRPKAAYVLRPDAWWAAWLAALVSPEVVTADDPRLAPFATTVVGLDPNGHATRRALQIAGASQAHDLERPLQLPPIADHQTAAHSHLERCGVTSQYVVIHPGSGASVKEWPVHRWRTVADALLDDGFRVVLTGTAAESHLCQEVASDDVGITSLAGETPLGDLIEVLRGARLVLGPDCGPLHLAVAVGTPSIHLFGPSDPARYGPWGDQRRHRVVTAGWTCSRCGDLSPARSAGCGCMVAIQPSDVIRLARDLLGTSDA